MWMSYSRLALCVCFSLLTAPVWATEPAPPAACPPTPARVMRSSGSATEYRGTVPGMPDLCVESRPDGDGRFYFGSWRSDWPGAGEAYPALRAAVLGPKGTSVTFDTHSVPGMQWHDTIRNEGMETLVVDGRSYTTLVIAHEREGFDGNTYHSVISSWRDVATGLTLKTVERQIAGLSYGPSTTWTATEVTPLD